MLVLLVDLLSLTIESIISVECMCLYVLCFCLFVYLFCVWTCSEEIKVRQARLKELEEKCLPPQSFSISSPSHMVPAAASLPVWAETSLSSMEDGQHSIPYNKLLNMVGMSFETEWVQCTSLVGCDF